MKEVTKKQKAIEYAIQPKKKYYRNEIFDKFIEENVKTNKNSVICDFCCGSGNTIELLQGKVGKIVGVDSSDEMIEICKKKFNNNSFVQLEKSSVITINLPKRYFDIIIIRMGLHHLKEKDKALIEANRLLKNNGTLIIIDKYYLGKFELIYKSIIKLFTRGTASLFKEYIVSKEEYGRLFLSNNFKIIKEQYLPYDKNHIGIAFMYTLKKYN